MTIRICQARIHLRLCAIGLVLLAGCQESAKTEQSEESAATSLRAQRLSTPVVSFGLSRRPEGVMLCPVQVGLARNETESAERIPVIIEVVGILPLDKLDSVFERLGATLKKMGRSKDDSIVKLELDQRIPCSVMSKVIDRSAAHGFREDFLIELIHSKLNGDEGDLIFSSEPPPKGSDLLEVSLGSDAEGKLTEVRLRGEPIGTGSESLAELHSRVERLVADGNGSDLVCAIKPDSNLDFGHLVEAISACRGKMDPTTQEGQSFIDRIHVVAP